MRNNINIKGNNQVFPYLIEYAKSNISYGNKNVFWHNDGGIIKLLDNDIQYHRNKNDWYLISEAGFTENNSYIPKEVHTSKIKVYIPNHSVSTYKRGIKYALTMYTWINGVKIDLGSFLFSPNDSMAISKGTVKNGNSEYFEMVEFDIIDPFYLLYSDEWDTFRKNVCHEPQRTNNNAPPLYVSLFVVNRYDGRYMMTEDWIGGSTCFTISNETDFLSLQLSVSNDPLGFKITMPMNDQYNWLLDYLYETYGINTGHDNIRFVLGFKNSDSLIVGPIIPYSAKESFGKIEQVIEWDYVDDGSALKTFFSDWNAYDEGWTAFASFAVIDTKYNDLNGIEELSLISNEVPITQEIFAMFTNGGSEIISDYKSIQYPVHSVVNKTERFTTTIERPNLSKIEDDIAKLLKHNNIDKLYIHKTTTTPLLRVK